MACNLRKKTNNKNSKSLGLDLDLISDLPSHIIDSILGRLPLHDAVRTSILSRKWRDNWLRLQHLDFGYQFHQYLKHVFRKKGLQYYGSKYQYELIVNKVFFLHVGPLVRVHLYIPKFKYSLPPDIDQWIVFLTQKKIKELILNYTSKSEPHPLPSRFFSSSLYLTHLDLCNFVFTPPKDFKYFPSLVTLKFSKVTFGENVFESLVAGSPHLEKLTFAGCSGIEDFTINAPKLEKLQFSANGEFKSICFKNVPKLCDVSARMATMVENVLNCQHPPLEKFLSNLPKITRLSLDGNFLKFLGAETVPERLPSTVENLKILKLNNMDFSNFDQISCVLGLIRNSTNLKELEVWAFPTKNDEVKTPEWGYVEAQINGGFTLDELRVVKTEFMMGLEPEVEFIRFLLACSPFLEKMFINVEFTQVKDIEEALKMATQLIQFYRASPSVDFRYLNL